MDNGKLIKLVVAAANAEKDAYDNYLKNGDRLTLCLPLIAGTLRDFEKYFAKRGELYEGSSALQDVFPYMATMLNEAFEILNGVDNTTLTDTKIEKLKELIRETIYCLNAIHNLV
jgi:hypothetical protein